MNLKRKLLSIGIVISILLVSITIHNTLLKPVEENVFNLENVEAIASYDISFSLDEASMTIDGRQRVTYKSTIDKDLSYIYFHLYPNTFRELATAPFEEGEINRVYPNGFSPGWIEILEVKEKNKTVDYKIMGEANNLLRITLEKPIGWGDTTEISISFKVKLPNAIGRFGYGDNTVNITNWYPILSVHDDRGWNLDPYYSIGDPFYSDMANYKVQVVAPKAYILASTGDLIKQENKTDTITYNIEAVNVRDFAMILSKSFTVKEAYIDDTLVKSYTLNERKEAEAIEYSTASLSIFNRLFGKYPYKQLSIVASDFFLGGMEYPNLVMISKDLYEMEEDFPLEYVIAHEIAHQWWYGIVGNNEIREPWLDEALTEYSTLMYFEEKYGQHIKEQIYEKMIKAQYESYILLRPDRGEGILRSLREFESNMEYSSIVYSRGAMFIEALRNKMGDEGFNKGIKEYYNSHRFKNVTTMDFYTIMQNNCDEELKNLFEEWLEVTLE